MSTNKLEQQIAQLDAKKKNLENRLRKQKRAIDTRRKILLGAMLLNKIENQKADSDDKLIELVKNELSSFLTRDQDKKLFDDILNNSDKKNQTTE